ncbi:deoxyhypusine synthase [Candidatus Woesearchaeota archaeon CG10_big_fil_rev_8_21_14_0_10_44_13]|nr:MAG: deoxyhypusine synthase [Candidatus Woesearchaeota archaeon CG10_big_fil_rev_8_21_14_0_10_44_13]
MEKVTQMDIVRGMKASQLVDAMARSGVFGAGRIAKAAGIAEDMIRDKQCKVFFGLAGAMVPGGMKNIIIDMLENGWIDVFVTTGANLTHDVVEALGYSHYQGCCNVDDKELKKKKIDRIYESYMPNEVYEKMEDFFSEIYDGLSREKSIKEFLWRLGEQLKKRNKKGNRSLLVTCFEKKIPIFCPGIADSGIGLMMWGNLAKGKSCEVRAFDDLKEILSIAWDSKKAGVFYVGGGVPKNYIQQAMQFSPKSAEYGIQITMDRPEPGGSSGAELREGISWGKMNEKGKFIDVVCDATIALPLIVAKLKDDINTK